MTGRVPVTTAVISAGVALVIGVAALGLAAAGTGGRWGHRPGAVQVELARRTVSMRGRRLRVSAAPTSCQAPWIPSVPGSANAFARVDVEVPFEGQQRSVSGARQPLLAVAGASFTAGVGAGSPFLGWPYLLGRLLGYRVMALGVPGAGYIRRGADGGGPVRRELRELHLGRFHPAVVVVQAGHNDIGEPPRRLADHVRQDVALIRSLDPGAAVVLLGVFPKGRPSAAARETSAVIARAAHRADRGTVVVQPIADHWHFPTIRGGLHPDPAGHRWIAREMAAVLRRARVVSATAAGQAPGGRGGAIEDRVCPLSSVALSRAHSGPHRVAARPATMAVVTGRR